MCLVRHYSALMVLILAAGSLSAADDRLAAPTSDEQVKAEKLIRQLFKNEYAIRTRPGYRALAVKLADQAGETKDDSVAKFVLYREAATVAAMAGELDLALNAVNQMAKQYRVSGAALKAKIYESMARYYPDAASSKILAERALGTVGEAIDYDDYEAVSRLLKVAESTAKAARSVPLISRVQARIKELDALKADYEQVKKVLAILVDKPDDPEANLAAGKYYCLQKGNWEKGLALLGKSGDAKLKELAAKDLATPTETAAQVELGEAWMALSQTEKDLAKKHLQWRARYWFEKALPAATGQVQTKLETYLKDIPSREGTALTKLYLSDMEEFDVKVGFGTLGKKGQLGYGQKRDSLSVNGQKSPNALSTHPPNFGDAVVKYKLGKLAQEFRVSVAINDTSRSTASPLTFRVLGDGKELWSSKPVQAARVVQDCAVSVAGVEVLELRVHCPGSYGEAHAVWLEPYILTSKP